MYFRSSEHTRTSELMLRPVRHQKLNCQRQVWVRSIMVFMFIQAEFYPEYWDVFKDDLIPYLFHTLVFYPL
jgi:hypothetical protein